MNRQGAVRVVQRAIARLARRTNILLMRAGAIDTSLSCPSQMKLVRVSQANSASFHDLVEIAMQSAGEPSGLAAPRFIHGDEFFGWQTEGKIVSFCWVRYKDRSVGPFQFANIPGRVFLYNSQTLIDYRGQGLYPALLTAIRQTLGTKDVFDFIGDINVQNSAVGSGIRKAGFVPVAEISYLTIMGRWQCAPNINITDASVRLLR